MDQILQRFTHITEEEARRILTLQAGSFQIIKNLTEQQAEQYVLNVILKHSDQDYRRKFVRVFYLVKEDDHYRGIALRKGALFTSVREMELQNEVFRYWNHQNNPNRKKTA